MRRAGKKSNIKNNVTKYRINNRIRAREVRLIGPDGNLGIVALGDALKRATEYGLDLVEISPHARPPVCKIIDFGKMRYEISKKEKQKKKNQSQVTKTIQLRPNIGEHDLLRKISDIQKFVDKGYRVVVQVSMKGRQQKYSRLALSQTIEKINENLIEVTMDSPQRQGNRITAAFSKNNK